VAHPLIADVDPDVPVWTDHLKANVSLKARLGEVFGTVRLDTWAIWCEEATGGNESILRATRVPALQCFVYVSHEGILSGMECTIRQI
jgi:hypothetical protein